MRPSTAAMSMVVQPPVVTLLIVLSAWLVHSLLGPWPPIVFLPVVGSGLIVLGFSFMLWARMLFTSRNTTLFVGQPSSQLVCDGPFRVSRNPMYVGVLVFLVGLAVVVGTWPFFVAVVGTFLFFNFFPIPREERMLRELFGERYLGYSTRVRRWI